MKNLKIFLFLIPVLAVAWASCKKEKSTHTIIKGRVFEANSTVGVPFARVRLLPGGSNEVVADANGNYQIEFNFTNGSFYEVLPIGPKNDPKRKYFQAQSLGVPFTPGETIPLDCSLTPFAYLKLKVKNVNPFDENDYISVTNSYGDGFSRRFLGRYVDTSTIGYRSANAK